jgi:Co/Zn/Cd efflux system component
MNLWPELVCSVSGRRGQSTGCPAKRAAHLLGASVVIGQVVWKLFHPVIPSYEVMGAFSLAGLAANGLCLWLLWQHRDEDINMSSVFDCSRNDIASNVSVFAAAGGVFLFQSGWPDIVVASLLAVLMLRSSVRVIRGAVQELREQSNDSLQARRH